MCQKMKPIGFAFCGDLVIPRQGHGHRTWYKMVEVTRVPISIADMERNGMKSLRVIFSVKVLPRKMVGRTNKYSNYRLHRHRWSLEWAAPTGTQSCTSLGYKDFCGSTALGTPESVRMNGQIDWQLQQISHLVCSLAGQRCSEA